MFRPKCDFCQRFNFQNNHLFPKQFKMLCLKYRPYSNESYSTVNKPSFLAQLSQKVPFRNISTKKTHMINGLYFPGLFSIAIFSGTGKDPEPSFLAQFSQKVPFRNISKITLAHMGNGLYQATANTGEIHRNFFSGVGTRLVGRLLC